MAARADLEPDDGDFLFDDDTDFDTETDLEVVRDNQGAAPAHRVEPEGTRRERFKAWRKQRPFIPGLLLIVAGIIMLAPAYFTLQVSDLLVMIATISGVSTLLIGAALIMFGIGTWLQPYAAPYLGVMGILVSIIALPTSNLGGFFIGSLLGVIGGALALAWEREPSLIDEPSAPTSPTPPRGGSTKIDLSKLRGASSVATVLGCVGLVAASMGGEPSVNAQEPPALPALPPLSANNPLEVPPLPTALPVPSFPSLPELAEQVPVPSVPGLPGVPTPNVPLPDPATLLPMPDLGPTRTIAPQNLSTVTADHVAITGNVRATVGMVNIGDVPTRTLVLTGDRLVARNLSLEVPGFVHRGLLTTGQVETRVIDGPVQVVATGLTATPIVAGVPTLPVTVDLAGQLGDILRQLGVPDPHPVPNVPVPNFVMDAIALGNVNMQMVSLHGKTLSAPAVHLVVPK